MKIRLIRFLGLISASFVCLCCSFNDVKTGNRAVTISDIKWSLSQSKELDGAESLKTVLSYDLRKQYSLGYPASFVISNDNNIYLVDNKNSAVFKVSADFQTFEQFIKSKNDSGFLEYPNQIKEFDNSIYINDNGGIRIVNKEGALQRTIQPQLGLNDFALKTGEEFLINPLYSINDKELPLILKLDSQGKKSGTIGQMQPTEYHGLENNVLLVTADSTLIVGYKQLPLIELYDLTTNKLIKSIKVKEAIFDDLEHLKSNKALINPEPGKYRLPKYIAGLKLFKERIYVLLHLPYTEIIEFTLTGEIVQRYRSKESRIIDYFGFDIRLLNSTKQFFVGEFDLSHTPSMMVFEESK